MNKEKKTTREAGISILLLEAEKSKERNPLVAEILNEAALNLADKIRKRNERDSQK
jgi:hypothetical protein